MARTKSNPYITLVCATEDEINTEYSEIIEGQIIFDMTNKIIYRDEVGRRIAYTGKQVQPSVCRITDNVITGSAGELRFGTDHPQGTVFYANDTLYEAKVNIKKGDVLSNSNAKVTDVMSQLASKVSAINDDKISKSQLKFEMKGSDLYITKSY